jgi:hypothetical protein
MTAEMSAAAGSYNIDGHSFKCPNQGRNYDLECLTSSKTLIIKYFQWKKI